MHAELFVYIIQDNMYLIKLIGPGTDIPQMVQSDV